MANTRPLVIGVGNPDAGDDAAGRIVARNLQCSDHGAFDIEEASGEATGLMALFANRARVVIVDACLSGDPPGTLRRIDARRAELPRQLAGYSSHGFGVAAAIGLAGTLGQLPETVILHTIEGAAFVPGEAPCAQVLQACAQLADLLRDELGA
ncbi:MAG: hydrogenase maturation protease [Rhizobiaceae bacterium]